ncbi:MAG: hypothetical protein WCS85_04280 [Candidatus Peribacteraceae bacterium]|jgi:hypothetical protein
MFLVAAREQAAGTFIFFPTIPMEAQRGQEDSGVIVPNELLEHQQGLKQQLAQLSEQYGIQLKAYLPKN